MLSQIQRFGGAMFTPVLLFPFAGIVVGIAIMLRNPLFVGEALTAPDNLFAQIVHIIEEGGWAVFRNMPLIFAVGLPIGLAKQAQGRACLAVLISFLTWNYFINAMGMTWGHFFGVDFSAEPVAGLSGDFPGHLVCRYPRVLRDDPLRLADAAGLAESADGH